MTEPAYIRKNETTSNLGDRVMLYYYTKECPSAKGGFSVTTYGIGIDMYTQLPDSRALKERRVIESVFTDKKEAQAMVDRLCEGCVTPMTLEDIIYDFISCDAM